MFKLFWYSYILTPRVPLGETCYLQAVSTLYGARAVHADSPKYLLAGTPFPPITWHPSSAVLAF